MKRTVLTLGLILMMATTSFAQKYGFVDSDYVSNNIPAFNTAQDQLDKLSQKWEQEIADGYEQVEQLYKTYQNEAALLSQDMKTKREEEIIKKEQEMKALQDKYIGVDGELYKNREELVKPIQDEILKAIKEIAVEGNYTAIFDSASGGNILYANPKNDLSDQVLEKLGYNN